MRQTLTTQEFIDRSRKIHGYKYNYSKVDYIKSSQKVIILCAEHGEFLQTPKSHLIGQGCKKCGYLQNTFNQTKSRDQFITKAKKIHGLKYDYSKVIYIKSTEKVIIICPTHGEFNQAPSSHIHQKSGCPKCGLESRIILQTKPQEKFVEQCRTKHGNKYDYSKVNYMNDRVKVIIICKEHGEFLQVASNHLMGQGCPKCGSVSRTLLNRKSTEEFIIDAKKVHGNTYDYDHVEYIGRRKKVIITCKIHGEFMQTPNNHLRGWGCSKCSGKCVPTTMELIEKYKLKHGDKYDYSKVNYIDAHKKIKIICSEHGEFIQTPNSHLKGQGCPKCVGRNLSTEEFLEQCKKIHGLKYDYSKVIYNASNEKIKIICYTHGEFLQLPGCHLIQKQGCPKCVGRNKTSEEFIKECIAKHGNKYDYSKVDYTGSAKKVIIICKEHGKFLQLASDHLQGYGCPKCAGKYSPTTEEFIEQCEKIHGNKYDYSKVNYITSQTKVKIICRKHGEFLQKPTKHLSGQGCSTCNSSWGESKIIKFGEIYGIRVDKQKSFDTCKNPKTNHKLRFDFYFPEKNILIEYDGIQHFKEGIGKIKFGKHIFTEQEYLKNKHRDDVKTKWAKDNNIKLIRIPYTKYDEIDDILTKELL